MPLNNPILIIQEARRLVESDRRSEIRLNANGGNSILLVCDPLKEAEYITHLKEQLPDENYSIIDLNEILIDFATQHKNDLIEMFELLQSSTHEIFKAPAGEESVDLFKMILGQISKVLDAGNVPVLVNTGSLHGTGIHNIHIMESDVVMKAPFPLLVLYPATIEPDRIMFLGKQAASRYRCMIIH